MSLIVEVWNYITNGIHSEEKSEMSNICRIVLSVLSFLGGGFCLWYWLRLQSPSYVENIVFFYAAALCVEFILLLIFENSKYQTLRRVVNGFGWVIATPFIFLRALIHRQSLKEKNGVKDTLYFEVILLIECIYLALLVGPLKEATDWFLPKLLKIFPEIMHDTIKEPLMCMVFIIIIKLALDLLAFGVYFILKKIGFDFWGIVIQINTNRVQLFLLVAAFIIVTFIGDALAVNAGTIVNVLTIVTLIMMLSDKNKEAIEELKKAMDEK